MIPQNIIDKLGSIQTTYWMGPYAFMNDERTWHVPSDLPGEVLIASCDGMGEPLKEGEYRIAYMRKDHPVLFLSMTGGLSGRTTKDVSDIVRSALAKEQ